MSERNSQIEVPSSENPAWLRGEAALASSTTSRRMSSTHKESPDQKSLVSSSTQIELVSRPNSSRNAASEDDTSALPVEGHSLPAPSQRLERQYFLVVCWGIFTIGWNDGSTGPMLLRIQRNYSVGYAVVSLVFIFTFIGYVPAGILNMTLGDRYGFGKVVVFAAVLQIIAFAMEASAAPFPVFALAFLVNGFGTSLINAQLNTFVAAMLNSAPKLGILHAAYGTGALASPLAATQFAQLPHWSYQYLISVAVAVVEIVAYVAVFRFRTQDELLGITAEEHAEVTAATGNNKYKEIFRLKTLHLLAFFCLVYAGLEVTMGGWIVTYLVEVRGGGPSTGYASSGFYAGLTIGRVGLLWVNAKVGTRRVIFLYCILAIGLEFIVWFVPSLVGDAIAACIVGLLLGPWFPLVVGASSRVLPRRLLSGCIGWISAFGQAGAALFPFITGALAQKFGIQDLQPLLVILMFVDLGLWWLVPIPHRSSE